MHANVNLHRYGFGNKPCLTCLIKRVKIQNKAHTLKHATGSIYEICITTVKRYRYQYISWIMHTVRALLCFLWLYICLFCPYPSELLKGHWLGNNMIARVDSSSASEGTSQYHYSDVIMSAMVSQITNLTIVYEAVYSEADQRKHQSSASMAFVRGVHRSPVNYPHK